MKISNKIIFSVLAICCQMSCMKEDLSECINKQPLQFTLKDISDNEIQYNHGEVFLFNSSGILTAIAPFSGGANYAPVKPGHTVVVNKPLAAGTYEIVLWASGSDETNTESAYTITGALPEVGKTHRDEMRIESSFITPRTKAAEINLGPERPKYNYHGTVEYNGTDTVYKELRTKQLTKSIAAKVLFIDDENNTHQEYAERSRIVITCSDQRLTFPGYAIDGEATVHYLPYATDSSEGILKSEYNKMTLDMHNTSPVIRIVDTGDNNKILYEKELFILLAGTNYPDQESLDKENNYNIEIVFNVRSTEVTIRINGWLYYEFGAPV